MKDLKTIQIQNDMFYEIIAKLLFEKYVLVITKIELKISIIFTLPSLSLLLNLM